MVNDAQILEIEHQMRSAPEPGGLESVSMGEEITVRKASATSAGYVTMWNTDTYEPSIFNLNNIRTKLREVHPDNYDNVTMRGKPAWTATEPSQKPWKGSITCPLHVMRPERTAYDKVGYPQCTYDVSPSEMEAQDHLKKKHPRTWRMIQDTVADEERKAQVEDREINRRILAKLAGINLDAPVIPAVVTEINEPSVMQIANVSLDEHNDITLDVTDVTTQEGPTAPKHPHQFAKPLGSPCKVTGCTATRQKLWQKRQARA